MPTNHLFSEEHGAICSCGLSMWHEVHFGGSRNQALVCYQRYQDRSRTPIGQAADKNLLAQKVYDAFMKNESLHSATKQMPKFKTIEEADAWLEEHNPVEGRAVPRFTTPQEADAWLEREAAHKRITHERITTERMLSSYLMPGMFVTKPGDMININFTVT